MIRDKRGQAAPKPGARMALSAAAAVVLAAFALAPTGALAEDRVAWGQKIWHDKAGCRLLPWLGRRRSRRLSPSGPTRRRSAPRQLTRDQIRETIQCGRPGTSMPHFDRFAYTDKRCYDMTAADLGDQMPNRSQVTLQRDEIDALADYVATRSRAWARLPNAMPELFRPRDGRLVRGTLPER